MYNDDEDMSQYKQEDSYHFSIPFEYIETNHGDDNYDIATTNMEIDVEWDDDEDGYTVRYYVPEMYLVDPSQGNGNEDDFYDDYVRYALIDELEALGVPEFALVIH